MAWEGIGDRAVTIPDIKRPTAIARGGPPSPLTGFSVAVFVSDSVAFATTRRNNPYPFRRIRRRSALSLSAGKPVRRRPTRAKAPLIRPLQSVPYNRIGHSARGP